MSLRIDHPLPPVRLEESSGGGSDWVTLIRAENDIDAHLLQGRLDQEGIEVRAIKDRKGPSWLHGGSDPWAPVDIWVRRVQLEDARLLLAELSFGAPAVEPRSAPLGLRHSAVVWWIAAIALGVAFTGIGLARSADYLERCGLSSSCPAEGGRP